jgi:dihydrofolate synthase/folylpolyglutamate synthase
MKTDKELLDDIDRKLSSIPMFSKKGAGAANFSLSGMRDFCDILGNPQHHFPSVHVAGTNGKGTTCRMLASIYQEAGYKVGIYTSPHLKDVRERFIVNGSLIDVAELHQFFESYWDDIKTNSFTYFEITTAIAFWYFSRSNVDIAIIETGLGGRLDATNVIVPVASVITSVGLDHTEILGHTIAEIAKEKSGIIKKEVPVVCGNLPEEAFNVVQEITEQQHQHANLHLASAFSTFDQTDRLRVHTKLDKPLDIHIEGGKITNVINAMIAVAVIEILKDQFPVEPNAIKNGIERRDINYPGKGVFFRLKKDKSWFFDGAHNRDSVKELINHLKNIAEPGNWTVVLSFMSDKINDDIAGYWNQFSNIWIYSQDSERAASIEQMKLHFPKAKVLNEVEKNGLPEFKTELVIFSGSFYFYSILSDWMGSGTASDK